MLPLDVITAVPDVLAQVHKPEPVVNVIPETNVKFPYQVTVLVLGENVPVNPDVKVRLLNTLALVTVKI